MRKRIAWLLAAVVLVFLLGLVVQFILKPERWQQRGVVSFLPEVLARVDTDSLAIALTIDDAPHPAVTPHILEILRRYDARATFFIIGSQAEAYPDLVQAIVDDGHELGNHLYLDRPSIQLEDDDFVDALLRTDALIRPLGPVQWCRPGSGWLDERMIELMAEHGYRPCLASVYPLDLTAPRKMTTWHFELNAEPGAILVLHDGGLARLGTLETLEIALPRLREDGMRVVTVTELVGMAR